MSSTSIARLKDSLAAYDRPHGTRSRYQSGCRCLPCRVESARYARALVERLKNGEANPIISAGRACRRLRTLAKHGMGLIVISQATGINRRTLGNIRCGSVKRTRKATSDTICRVSLSDVSDYSLVPAKPVWRMIDNLRIEGYSYRQLELKTGIGYQAMWARKPCVRAVTKMKVEKFYNRTVSY